MPRTPEHTAARATLGVLGTLFGLFVAGAGLLLGWLMLLDWLG